MWMQSKYIQNPHKFGRIWQADFKTHMEFQVSKHLKKNKAQEDVYRLLIKIY